MCHAMLGEWEALNEVLSQLEALVCPVHLEATKTEILASVQARAALCRADLKSAIAIARELADRPAAGSLFIWLEEPAISRIRVDLASGKRAAASRALKAIGAIRQDTVAQHLLCQDIDLMLLEALGREQLGAREEALALLEEALGHAVPANWSRPFIELGDSLGTLLPHSSLSEENLGFLSLQCGINIPTQPVSAEQESVNNHAQLGTASREHFTNRELDILELLAQRFRNKEIASQLYISTHTVNYHLKHIYQKLDVSGRRKAVARAIELGVMTD
jgi:LuxR family maltose regulon positive regulatory protein